MYHLENKLRNEIYKRCSTKLYNIVRCEEKLWKNIHAVCNGCSSCYIRLLPFLSGTTTTLHLCKSTVVSSSNCEDIRMEPYFLKRLKQLPNLRSFALENHSLRYKHLLNLLRCPPKWLDLTELRLKKIDLLGLNGQPCLAFQDLHLHLPNLEIVDVSHCSWVTSDVLWSMSKYPHLKTLIMVGCNEIKYIVPPYTPYDEFLGTSLVDGFCELETINLRLTDVTFEEIGIFKDLKNLRHIYLEKPEENVLKITEQLERRRQMLDYYHNLQCWWGVPTYIIGDMMLREYGIRIFRLSEHVGPRLKTLVARNYTEITDLALEDVKENLTCIKYLDITGTQCTAERVALFQIRCPNVTVCHDGIQFEKLPFELSND